MVNQAAKAQGINIVDALSQGRELQRHDVKPKKQIFPKRALVDFLFQVAIGRGNQPEIHGNIVLAPQAFEGAFLKDAKQLGLHGRIQVPDFIQEQRAAFSLFAESGFSLGGAGKGPAFIPEQFAFKEFLGNGRAIHADKRRVTSGAVVMQDAGDEFFARAGFTLKQNGRLCVFTQFPDLSHQFPHAGAVRDEILERITAGTALAFKTDPATKGQIVNRAFDNRTHSGQIHAFNQKVIRPQAHGFHGVFNGPVGRQQDNQCLRGFRPDMFEGFEAGHARHFQIEEDDVGNVVVQSFEKRFSGVKASHLVPAASEPAGNRRTNDLIIIRDKNRCVHIRPTLRVAVEGLAEAKWR